MKKCLFFVIVKANYLIFETKMQDMETEWRRLGDSFALLRCNFVYQEAPEVIVAQEAPEVIVALHPLPLFTSFLKSLI